MLQSNPIASDARLLPIRSFTRLWRAIGRAALAPSLMLLSLGCSPHPGGQGAGSAEQWTGGDMETAPRPFSLTSGNEWLGHAVCYGPHRDGQWPGGPAPESFQIREDLHLMLPHWRLIRIYGSAEFGRELLEAIRAEQMDVKVMLGVWIAAEETRDEGEEIKGAIGGASIAKDPAAAAANRRETAAAIALADEYPAIVAAVCVGNETQVSWSAHRLPPALLIEHIRSIRAAVKVPVTTADDYQYWIQPDSRLLAREVDFITMHAHPMWNGKQLNEALPWLEAQVAAVQAVHPDRLVVIGETGWATSVAGQGEQARLIKGQAGETEQAVFHAAVREWAAERKITTFFFEAFDENWKGGEDPSEVEKHWGLWRADRTPKAAIR